ncbi:L-threonylcarbamoyladenylate synthase [Candidatus Saccharibacteria bacterium]|nr:L-threonylcarbamoyladenylate synthase [Candidatus Saccharibacteria bacterium]
MPTETVWGLMARFDDEKSIGKLMAMKDREVGSGKVFAMLVANEGEIARYAEVSERAAEIISRYLPGELTIVLPKRGDFKNKYYDNFETIGFRLPEDEFLRFLAWEKPLLLTSANRRGAEPLRSAQEIREELPEVDLIIDGEVGGSLPTTVVRVVGDEVETLREGKVVVSLCSAKALHGLASKIQ